MFKNKHILTAMIVAPLLAIFSYFATDYIVGDLPELAEEGSIYSLIARSNCRYQSGQCTLENGDIEVDLRLTSNEAGQTLLLARSSHPLKGAQAALVNQNQDQAPQTLVQTDKDGEYWQLVLNHDDIQAKELRIAMQSNNTMFYASTDTTFFDYDTIFPRDQW